MTNEKSQLLVDRRKAIFGQQTKKGSIKERNFYSNPQEKNENDVNEIEEETGNKEIFIVGHVKDDDADDEYFKD